MNNNEAQQGQEGAGLPNCAELIGSLPFWTRLLYFALAFLWLLDLLTNLPSTFIAARPDSTFDSLWLWTLITSIFYVDRLLIGAVMIYNFNTFLPKIVHDVSCRSKKIQPWS